MNKILTPIEGTTTPVNKVKKIKDTPEQTLMKRQIINARNNAKAKAQRAEAKAEKIKEKDMKQLNEIKKKYSIA